MCGAYRTIEFLYRLFAKKKLCLVSSSSCFSLLFFFILVLNVSCISLIYYLFVFLIINIFLSSIVGNFSFIHFLILILFSWQYFSHLLERLLFHKFITIFTSLLIFKSAIILGGWESGKQTVVNCPKSFTCSEGAPLFTLTKPLKNTPWLAASLPSNYRAWGEKGRGRGRLHLLGLPKLGTLSVFVWLFLQICPNFLCLFSGPYILTVLTCCIIELSISDFFVYL